VLTEDDDRLDSDTDSNFSPALKKKALGDLPDRFSATLNEYGPAAGPAGGQAHKRRKSPSPTPKTRPSLHPV
jgi:hypothetical protein